MNCREIQEIIITDYIDGQLDDESKYRIEDHLAHCHHCKELSLTAQEAAVKPFIDTEKQKPPEIIWDQIREAVIVAKPGKTGLIAEIWQRLRALVYIPKPVFALTTIVTLIFMIGILPQFTGNNPAVKINERSQMEYLSYLTGISGDISASDSVDWGTPIEKYFL